MSSSLVEQFVPAYADPKLDRAFFERLFGEMDRRFLALEMLRQGLEGVLANATTLAVQKIDEYLQPRIDIVNEQLQAAQTLHQQLQTAVANIGTSTLAQLEPLVAARFAAVTAAIAQTESTITSANASISVALAAASSATTAANTAATAANAAAGGVATAISSGLATTRAEARRKAIAFAVAL